MLAAHSVIKISSTCIFFHIKFDISRQLQVIVITCYRYIFPISFARFKGQKYHWHYSIYLNQKCNSFFNIWSAIFTNQFFCCLRNWLEKILSRIIFYSLFHIFILPWTLMLWNEKIYKCSFFQRWISTKKCRALICKRSQATGKLNATIGWCTVTKASVFLQTEQYR